MMKRFLMLGLFIGLLIFSMILLQINRGLEESENKLVAITGNAVYNVWEPLNEMTENGDQLISIERLQESNERLERARVHAEIVDRAVGKESLAPVITNLSFIGQVLEETYVQKSGLTDEEQVMYGKYIEQVDRTIDALYDIYYIPDSEGQVTLDVTDHKQLIDINGELERLKEKL